MQDAGLMYASVASYSRNAAPSPGDLRRYHDSLGNGTVKLIKLFISCRSG